MIETRLPVFKTTPAEMVLGLHGAADYGRVRVAVAQRWADSGAMKAGAHWRKRGGARMYWKTDILRLAGAEMTR